MQERGLESAVKRRYAGWYAFQHPGGEFEVCLRPGGVFHAPGFPTASRWCALPGPNPAIAITWGKYGDYKLDVTDGVLRELAGSRVPAAGRAPGPNLRRNQPPQRNRGIVGHVANVLAHEPSTL